MNSNYIPVLVTILRIIKTMHTGLSFERKADAARSMPAVMSSLREYSPIDSSRIRLSRKWRAHGLFDWLVDPELRAVKLEKSPLKQSSSNSKCSGVSPREYLLVQV